MTDTTFYQTAIHEAGHAVAHIRLGLNHDGAMVSDVADAEGRLGYAPGEGVDHVWNAEGAGPVVLAFCAGYAALVAAGYADDVARRGADNDFEQADYLIGLWDLPGGIEHWQAQAAKLMRQPENVAAVALVAEYLVQHLRLGPSCVDLLVDLADGEITEAEFTRWLQWQGARS